MRSPSFKLSNCSFSTAQNTTHEKPNTIVSLMSICSFSNSYSSEILAFEKLKFWLITEHQILQESETFHIFCTKKKNTLDSLACLVNKLVKPQYLYLLNFSCQFLIWPAVFTFRLGDGACRSVQGMVSQLWGRGRLLLWVLQAATSSRRWMPSSPACLKWDLPKSHLKEHTGVRKTFSVCFAQKTSV